MKSTILGLVVIAIIMGLFFMFHIPRQKHVLPKEKPVYGQVTAKEWVPGYVNDYVLPMQSGDVLIMIPMSDYIPDVYYLKVAGRIVSVKKEVFEKAQIGDTYGTPPEAEK